MNKISSEAVRLSGIVADALGASFLDDKGSFAPRIDKVILADRKASNLWRNKKGFKTTAYGHISFYI